jgi:hypothetical protein
VNTLEHVAAAEEILTTVQETTEPTVHEALVHAILALVKAQIAGNMKGGA